MARPWLDVENVPGLLYSPSGKNTRGLRDHVPGGGYEDLAIDLVRHGRVRARALTATRRLWIHSSVLEASV